MLEVARRSKKSNIITGLQKNVDIYGANGKIGKRESDFFDGDRFIDAKALSDPRKISEGMNPKIKTESGSKPGQAFLDFVRLGNDPSAKAGYVFGANAKGKELEILELLIDAAKKYSNSKALKSAWGLIGKNSDVEFSKRINRIKKQFSIEAADFN